MSPQSRVQRRRRASQLQARSRNVARSGRHGTGAGQYFLSLIWEQLEDRRMLSGSNDPAMLAAITSALSSSNSSGLISLGTKLRDPSVLGRELPLVGTAIGTRYDPATALGTIFGQLSGSFTNVSQLGAALDAIPGIDVTQTPVNEDARLELRLHLTTQLTITAPLDDAFGPLHLDLNGAVDISIGLDFQFSIGAIYSGTSALFYIDATNDQLAVNANVTAPYLNETARLGFTDITVSKGNALFAGKFAIDLLDPGTGTEGAGRVTLGEIGATPIGSLVATQVQATSGPSLAFDVSSSLVQGAKNISLTWTNINDLASVTTNLGTLGVYQQLEQLSASVVSAGLSSLAGWVGAAGGSQNLLGRPLPIVGTQLKDALDIAGLFKSHFIDQVGSFNSAQTLAIQLGKVGDLHNLVTQLVDNELTYRLDLSTSISKGLNIDLGLDNFLDLQLDANSLNLQAGVAASLTFGVDLTTETFFLADDGPQPELRVNATIDVTGLSAGVHVGFLSANATNGLIHFSANASLDAADPSGDHRIGMSDMAGGAGTIGSFVTMALAGSGNVNMTIDAPLLGIAGKNLFAQWPDITDASTFTTNAGDFVDLNSYKNIAASAFSFGLKQLSQSIITFVDDPHGGNNPLLIPLPLVKKSIADLVDLDTLLKEQITKYTDVVQDQVTGALNQPFRTSQQLLNLLNTSHDGSTNKATEKVENSDLKYTLQLDKTIQKTFPFQFDVASALDLQVSGSVTVNMVVHVDVTFGVNKDTRIFFIATQATPVFSADTTTTLNVSGDSRLGFLGLSIAGATANLNTHLALSLTDTMADDITLTLPGINIDPPPSPGKITATELLVGPISDVVHADFTGTAAAMLPLVASVGDYSKSGTLTAIWADVKQPSTFVLDKSQIQDMLRFQSITPDMVLAGIKALPNLLRQIAGNGGLAKNLPVIGTNVQGLITLADQLDSLLTILSQFDTAQKLQQALQTQLAPLLSPAIIAVQVASADIRFVVHFHQGINAPALGFNVSQQIGNTGVGFQVGGQVAATGAIDVTLALGVSFDVNVATADRFYVVTGTDPNNPVSSASLSLGVQTTQGLTAAATFGELQVGITNGTITLASTASTAQPASLGVALKDASATPDGKITLQEINDLAGQGQLASVLATPTIDAGLHVSLPVNLPPPPNTAPLVFIADWQLHSVDDLSNPPTIAQSTLDTLQAYLDQLKQFDINTVLYGLQLLVNMFQQLATNQVLNARLPLINKTPAQLLPFIQQSLAFFNRVKSDASAVTTPTGFDTAINNAIQAAGFSPDQIQVTHGANNDLALGQLDYVIHFHFAPTIAPLNFDLGLGGGLLSLNTQLIPQASFDATLEFGLNPQQGFYLVDQGTTPEIRFHAGVTTPINATGKFGPFALDYGVLNGLATLAADFNVDLVSPTGTGGPISISQLVGNSQDAVQPKASGTASVDLPMGLHIGDDGPGVKAEFSAFWNASDPSHLHYGSAGGPTDDASAGFSHVQYELGEWIGKLVGPVLKKVEAYNPLPADLIDVMLKPLPILNVTPMDVLLGTGALPPAVKLVFQIAQLLDQFGALDNNKDLELDLSAYHLGGTPPAHASTGSETGGDGDSDTGLNGYLKELKEDYNIELPFYDDLAGSVVKTLLGQPIDLITWNPPEFRKEKDYNIEFPVFTYGIPYLADVAAEGFIEGGFGFFADIELGLSTQGLLHQTPGNPLKSLLDGFFIGDNKPDPNGNDALEVGFFGEVTAGIAGTVQVLGFDAAQIYGGGRITGTIGLDLADVQVDANGDPRRVGQTDHGGDNRIYFYEIQTLAQSFDLDCILTLSGELTASLVVGTKALCAPFGGPCVLDKSASFDFVIADWTLPCADPKAATLASVQGNTLAMVPDGLPNIGDIYRNPPAGTPGSYTQGTVTAVSADGITLENATRYLATTDPNTHLTTYQAVPLNGPVTVSDPRLSEKNRTSLFIHYNRDNQPLSLRIQRIENGVTSFQDFPLSDLQGVSTLLVEGTPGSDDIRIDPSVTQVIGSLTHLTVNAGYGDDKVDFGQIDPMKSGLLNTTIDAGAGNDTILGTFASDLILGGDGNDTLSGEDGNDEIHGGAGDDEIDGGKGNDLLYGDAGADNIAGQAGDNRIFGNSGDDTIVASDGNDTIAGDGLDPMFPDPVGTLFVGGGSDYIIAGGGNDIVHGGAGNDRIFGGSGNDFLYGEGGADEIHGDEGDDYVEADTPGAASLLLDGVGSDHLYGGEGYDVLVQTVNAGQTLTSTTLSGQGSDTWQDVEQIRLTGGNGDNTFDVSGFGGTAFLDGGSGSDRVVSSGDFDYALSDWNLTRSDGASISLMSIERASLAGGGGDNTFDVTRWTGTAAIDGGGGLDIIVSQNDANFELSDTSLTRSTGGAFTLSGIGKAQLTGGIGNNVIDATAYSGMAILFGGEGNDILRGGSGDDQLDGGLGTDQLFGNAGRDNLVAGGGVGDALDGGDGDDILAGSDDGADVLRGGPGRDRLNGNGGNDQLFGGPGDDILDGGPGDDTLSGDTGSELLIGGAGHDMLYGQNAADSDEDNAPDYLYGDFGTNGNEAGSGRDRLYGQGGSDRLFGEGDDDFLDGGTEADDRLDYGGGEGANPADFVPPTPTSDPTPQPATGTRSAAGSLPVGILQPGRWGELFGSATGLGLSGDAGQSVEPAVVADAVGPIIAWADNRNGNFEIYIARQTATGWQELGGSAHDGGISSTAGGSRRPSIALDSVGNPIVAWTELNGTSSDIQVARFDPAANVGAGGWIGLGSSLGAGGISGTGAADGARIVNTASGPVVTWIDHSAGVANVYVRQFSGGQWLPPAAGSASGSGVSASTTDIAELALATDGTKMAVSWTQTVAGVGQIYLREFSGGSWQALAGSASGGGLSNTAGNSNSPSLAYSGGSLFAAWQDATSGHSEIYVARYGGTAWLPAGNSATTAGGVSNTKGSATRPQLAAGGGKLELLWADDRTANFTGNTTALYAKVWTGSGFVEELPGDASARGIDGTLAQTLAVALDSSGHSFVVWQDVTAGQPEIYVRGNRFRLNNVYYVNDDTTSGDTITVATGAASNSGQSPSLPKPSVQAVLDAYTLGPGDVIVVDAGSYADGFTITAADSGVSILGSPQGLSVIQGPVILDGATGGTHSRLNLTGKISVHGSSQVALEDNVVGGPGFTIDGGSNIIVAHNQIAASGTAITVMGGTSGASIESNKITAGSVALGLAGRSRFLPLASTAAKGIIVTTGGASGLWLHGNQISGVGTGIGLNAAGSGQIADNRIVALSTGMAINVAWTGPVQRNDVQGANVGVLYAAAADFGNNRIHNNQTGVVSTVAGEVDGLGFVGGGAANQIFANTTGVQLTGQLQGQHVYANATGVVGSGVLGGRDLDHANVIERNTTGASFAGPVSFNRIARNGVGIVASGQTIDHNLIYRNTSAGVRIVGANVEVLQNTFFTTQGYGLELHGPQEQVEVVNNVFWADGGYDLWLDGDIRGGFFSDYNDLYAEGSGLLVHWLKDFADVLDWQADVARWDLHSLGRTVVNPQWAQPQFADLARDDFRVSALAAGQRLSSPTLDSGDLRLDVALPTGQPNLLLNASFESGLTSWTTNAGAAAASSAPGAFDGTSFFSAGTPVLSFAEQTIDLTAQYPAVQLDSQDFVVVFGGRIRAAAETPPDRGRLLLTFQNGSSQQLSQAIVTAANTSGRWELVGDRIAIPVGTRKLIYRFEAARFSGVSNDAWLDHAFAFVRPETSAPDQGAYESAATDSDLPTPHLALRTPDLYVDWERDKPQTIRWDSFGNAADAPVRIDLLADGPDGPQLFTTLATAAPDSGQFVWTPASFGVAYGTHNLRIEISLVGNAGVLDRSQESFTVPENTNKFYVNDASTTADEYTTAVGSNRNTGKLSAAPKPYPNNILRTYALGAGQTLYVDTGDYALFDTVVLSGTSGIGDDEGFMLTGPADPAHVATLRHALLGATAPLLDLNDADLMTIAHLSLVNAQYGLLVHNGSVNLAASYLTISSSALDGIHLDTLSTATTFDHLTISDSGRFAIAVDGSLDSLTSSNVTHSGAAGVVLSNSAGTLVDHVQSADNGGDGISLSNVGAAHVQGSQFFNNRGRGVAITSDGAVLGGTDLALGLGNLVHDNGLSGIDASGNIVVAGNTVFGQTAFGAAGINAGSQVVVTHNVVHHNANGIISNGPVIENRTYANAAAGIVLFLGGVAQGNVIYSNATGIQSGVGGYGNGTQMSGNLLYANSAQGIWFFPTYASGGVNVTSNTIYQPAGDAVRIDAPSSNLRLRNNVFAVSLGYAFDVTNTSQFGFQSDYNDFLVNSLGKVAFWQGVARPTLVAWQNTAFTDQNSLAQNPLFVDFDGPDNVLGYSSPTTDGRDDDFHLESRFGSFHGGSLAPVVSVATGLPIFLIAAEMLDASQSPLIDRGDAGDSAANEPAPNGGFINLGFEGNTAQASKSPAQYVLALSPDGGESWPADRTFAIHWRSQDFAGNVNIDLLRSSDLSVAASLATGIANSGQFSWTVPESIPPGNQYLVRVTRTDSGLFDTGNAPFTITPPIHTYYVNDDIVNASGDWTTAPGDDANDGLSAAKPKASVRAVLEAYTLGPGDTILVDAGTYQLASNVVITAADEGVRIEGYHDPAFTTRAALLDRGNQNGGSYVIELQGANDATLDHLSLTGGNVGVYAADNAGANRLTVSNSEIYGNLAQGIFLGVTNEDAVVVGNRIHDQTAFFAMGIQVNAARATISGNTLYLNGNNSDSGYGIYAIGADDVVSGNDVSSQTTGIHADYGGDAAHRIIVSNNQVHSNARTGIEAGSSVLVAGNTVNGQLKAGAIGVSNFGGSTEIAGNTIFDNDNGLTIGALAHDNRVYHNTHIGIQTGASGVVRNNVVYSNSIGIQDYFGGYYNTSQVLNNLIYDNSDAGILVATPYGSGSPLITSNTVYQPVGDAIRLLGGSPYVRLRNNILWVQSGYDILVPSDSEVGFQSDYNALVTTGSGKLGQWEGRDFTSRVDWFYELGFDGHSQTADPLFVNPAGPDGVLGYNGGMDHGQDDDFHLQAISPVIDAGDPAAPYFNEPFPNGDRLNLGNYGDTAEATTSPAQTVQMVSPNGLEKFEVGQQVSIQWRSSGLTASRPVLLVNAGGPAVQNWLANSYETSDQQFLTITDPIDTSGLADPAPADIYQTYAYISGPPGGRIDYQLPVPDGSYVLRLHFVAPADTTPGSRVMDIYVQGNLVRNDFEALTKAGGKLKATAESFSVSASGGRGISLDLVNKTYGGAILSGIELTELNPAGVTSPAVDLDLSTDSGQTWSNVASGLPIDHFGQGSYLWTAGPQTNGNAASFRVRAESDSRPQDISDAPFTISNAGHDYYINDNSTAGDVFTTATGNNANSGKSPDQPMASLAALLSLYDVDPGDVIHVDTGTSHLVRNVVITNQDSGVRIEGPATATAILDRGNLAGGTYAIQLDGATGVTLDHLSITGAYVGVYAADNAASDHLIVTNCDIYGNSTAGVQVGLTDDFPLISGNRIHDQSVFFASGILVTASAATVSGNTLYRNGNNSDGGYGIWVNGADTLVTGNETFSQTTGIHADYGGDVIHRIIVSNNTVHGNARTGIETGSAVLVIGNSVYGQLNPGAFGISNFGGSIEIAANAVHDNDNGISVAALAHDNRVYHNTHIGIQTGASGVVRNNVVYSNSIGIQDYFGGYYNTSQVLNNLIYDNSDAGILVATPYGSGSPLITSNTVYQPVGDAIRLLGGSPYVRLRNNILWVQSGYDILVPSDSEVGFQSDYNALVTTGSGKLGQWEGRDFTSRVDWFYELGFDGHSQTADPLFVNPAGPDGVLGYNGGMDHGQDDDFHLQSGSPAIDAGNPADSFFNEPTPNGDRINLGNYGNTPEAATSPAQAVQVLSPNGREKFEVGQQVLIQWRSSGLTPSRTVALINAGGPTFQNWLANSYQTYVAQTATITDPVDTTGLFDPAPAAIYQSYAVDGGPPGGQLAYHLPVPDGSYQLRLHLIAPSDTTPGSRVMDIYVQGALARQDYDVFTHAGGKLKATAETFFVTASGGSGISLDLVNKTYGGAILSGIELSALNPSGVASPSVDLDLSTNNGQSWTSLATGLVLDHFGQGSYLWTAGPEAPGNTAFIRVRAHDGSQPQDTSDAGFLISNNGQDYYVNDDVAQGDVFTTAFGNNANSGKSPSAPMASLSALLAAYNLDPGDVIHVDTGNYRLATNMTITAEDAGVRIDGPLSATAMLDRGNQAAGSYVIELQHASGVTLSHLAVTGGYIGVFAASGADSNQLTVDSTEIYDNFAGGISLDVTNDDSIISNNRLHDQIVFFAPGIFVAGARAQITGNAVRSTSDQPGLYLSGPQILATGNDVSGASVGINAGVGGGAENLITVQGNTVHDNSRVGIQGGENVLITGNRVYGQQLDSSATGISTFSSAQIVGNTVYNNRYGIVTASRASGNRVYHNSIIGILTGLSGIVDGNYVYSNSIGIQSGIGGYYNAAQILNNLVYANTNQGILVGRTYAASGVKLVNNTVYQPVGDAILLDGDTNNLVLRNNVLWIDAGYAVDTTTSNHAGFDSDYNLFQTGASINAHIGFWLGADQHGLANWQSVTSQDSHSQTADAGFVDVNGADNILGYDVTGNGYDGGLDDNFYARKNSNTIDRGDPAPAPLTDIEGQSRVDDLGSPNLGPNGSIIDLGAYEFRGSSLDSTPPVIVGTFPDGIDSAAATGRLGQFTITYSEGVNPLDARAPASYELRSAGPDGTFGDGDDVVYPLVPQLTGGTVVTLGITVDGGLIPIGKYRFTVFSSASTSIHDLTGLALDGDADGSEQGNYFRVFNVTANGPPSFQHLGDQSATDENPDTHGPALQRAVSAWAFTITIGPPIAAGPSPIFIVTNNNHNLFSVQPAIDSTGRLTYTPAPNAHGTATVTVVLQDSSDATNTSAGASFHIEIIKLHKLHNVAESGRRNGLDVAGSTNTQPDGFIVAGDVITVINYINAKGSGHIPASSNFGPPYCDVDGDDEVVATDVIKIINYINANPGQSEAEATPMSQVEANSPPSDLISLLALDIAEQAARRRRLS